MYLSEQDRQRIMDMSRSEMIEYICSTGYIQPLPIKQQGYYLFGKTKNNRAVCLAWEDQKGCIKRDAVIVATYEIEDAELGVPFVFFGRSSLFGSDATFHFLQIPWVWERRNEPILPIIQGMNMRGKPEPLRRAKSCQAS